MTSGQESSPRPLDALTGASVESLAGAFHPHAIEVQDFAYYARIVDVRSPAEYENDHIPGAVRLEPPVPGASSLGAGSAADDAGGAGEAQSVREDGVPGDMPAGLAALVAPVRLDQAVLIYCGQGGRVSQPLARALRWRGWTVDVLPGGWINYRRWVQAGLEILPRLMSLRVVASSLGSEVAHVLRALRDAGQQVLDVEELAGWRHGGLTPSSRAQPTQAWFESQLLRAIRELDPRLPVWTGAVATPLGALALPGSLADALRLAPAVPLQAGLPARVKQWRKDEPLLAEPSAQVLVALTNLRPALGEKLSAERQQQPGHGLSDSLLAQLLSEHLDRAFADDVVSTGARPFLPPLVVDSFAPAALAAGLRAWLPGAPTASPAD